MNRAALSHVQNYHSWFYSWKCSVRSLLIKAFRITVPSILSFFLNLLSKQQYADGTVLPSEHILPSPLGLPLQVTQKHCYFFTPSQGHCCSIPLPQLLVLMLSALQPHWQRQQPRQCCTIPFNTSSSQCTEQKYSLSGWYRFAKNELASTFRGGSHTAKHSTETAFQCPETADIQQWQGLYQTGRSSTPASTS